jgi:undecaprenyl-diphosphatase
MVVLVISLIKNSKTIRGYFFILTAVLLVSGAVTFTIKSVTYRDRPFDKHSVIMKRSTGGDSSFPSGHTLEAFAMAMAFSGLFNSRRKYLIPLFLWATLVGYSRVALGVHYPSDVFGGMILGSLIGWFIPWLFKRKSQLPME